MQHVHPLHRQDIPMLHAAGLGIAFCAKPKAHRPPRHKTIALFPRYDSAFCQVQEVSRFRINQMDLSTVLFLIGISDSQLRYLLKLRPGCLLHTALDRPFAPVLGGCTDQVFHPLGAELF